MQMVLIVRRAPNELCEELRRFTVVRIAGGLVGATLWGREGRMKRENLFKMVLLVRESDV